MSTQCIYYFNKYGINASANSVEELRDKVLEELNKKQISFQEVMLSKNFQFYDSRISEATTPTEIQQCIDKAIEAGKNLDKSKGCTVTDLASKTCFPQDKKNEDAASQSNQSAPIYVDKIMKFNEKFGTLVHAGIQYHSNPELYLKECIEPLERLINETYNSLSADDLKEARGRANWYRSIIDFLETHRSGGGQDFQISLSQVITNIEKYYTRRGYVPILMENQIAQMDKKGVAVLYGRPDLVLFNARTGEIEIVDFKTSALNVMSQNTKKYHFLQLQAYKKIFESWGIPADKIHGSNYLISYSGLENAGLKFDPNSDPNQVVDPEKSVDGQISGNVYALLKKFFPDNLKPISNQKERTEKVKSKQNTFCDGQMLKRFSTESMKESLTYAAKNKNRKYIYSIEKVANLELKGDKIIGYDIDDASTILFEEKVDDLVKKEQAKVQENAQNQAGAIRELLISKDPSRLKNLIQYNKNGAKSYWENLYKYCSPNYSIVPCPALEELGIIVVKHATRGYEFIQLVSDASNLQFCQDPNANILRSIVTNPETLKKYKESGELPRGAIGNLYALRALFAISEYSDIFKNDAGIIQINGINVISVNSGHSMGFIDNSQLKLVCQVLQECCKTDTKIEHRDLYIDIYDKVKDIKFSSTDEQWSYMVVDALAASSVEYSDTDLSISPKDWDSYEGIQAKLDALEKVKQIIQSKYEEQLNSVDAHGKSISDESIIHVLNCIKALQNQLRGMVEQENEMNSYSLNFQESIVAGINLLTKGSIAEFTKSGMQLTGLAQGLSASNAYASPSRIIQRFQHFYDVATSKISTQLQAEATELNAATEKFIEWGKKNGLVGIADSTRGNHENLYRSLFKQINGQVSQDMLFQNPYSPECTLSEAQKQFLEVALWQINRHRSVLGLTDQMKKLSYKELKENSEYFNIYKNLINSNSKLLEVPLKRRQGIQGSVNSLRAFKQGKKSLKEVVKYEMDKARSMIEREFLDDHQKQAKDAAAKEAKKYINYFKENELSRASRVENVDPSGWEWNINNLAIEYALADYKQYYFNDLLQIADNQFGAITLIEQLTGQDLSKQTQELSDRIQVSIYNKTLVDKEFTDLLSVMGIVKSGMALTKIALRPTLLVKEMLLGRIRNTMSILTSQIKQDEGREIKMSHLMDAAKEIFGPNFFGEKMSKFMGIKSPGHKSLADLLNDTYAINDRDLSVIGDKFSYDRYGLHNWASRMLYINTIAPDWFNRMIIFVAKMKADGTWDAHKIGDNGELVYDMSKDKRVAAYWNHRNDKYPPKTSEYAAAKEFYRLRMQQFAREGWTNKDGQSLQFSDVKQDAFPRAYTTQEEESIKEQIGLIYGYYSHQERATMQKGLWWTMYTQFLTFLPAEIRKNFAIGTESSIYRTIHKKDGITGKPLYWKNAKPGELHETTTEPIDKETGEHLAPVLEQVSDPYTGLVTSTVYTVGRICKGDMKALKDNPQQLKNAELFLFNLLFGTLLAAIAAAIIGSGTKAMTPNIAADVLKKTSRELDVYHSVIEPVGNFGVIGTDFLNNIFTSSFNAVSNDGYSLLDLANANFAIVKDLHLNLDV